MTKYLLWQSAEYWEIKEKRLALVMLVIALLMLITIVSIIWDKLL
jgi:hypothetical protein